MVHHCTLPYRAACLSVACFRNRNSNFLSEFQARARSAANTSSVPFGCWVDTYTYYFDLQACWTLASNYSANLNIYNNMIVNKKFDRLRQWGKERMGGEVATTTSDEFKMLMVEMDQRHQGNLQPNHWKS